MITKSESLTKQSPKSESLIDLVSDYDTLADEGELTVIHFISRLHPKYKSGSWCVRVYGSIFIRPVGSQDKLGLVYAYNIPLAPGRRNFKSVNDELHFTLFFPALPKGTDYIDIIEKEGGNSAYFNFYGVAMKTINNAPLIHYIP